MVIPPLAGALIALVLSALFSTAEFSLFSLGDARIRTLVDEGFQGAGAVDRLRSHPERVLVLLHTGDATAAAFAAGLAAWVGHMALGIPGLVLGIVVAAVLLGVVADLVPMQLSAHYSVRIALVMAPMLESATRLLAPVLAVLAAVGRVEPRSARDTVAGSAAERQIREIAALGHDEGVIEDSERQLIERVFRLDETRVWDIMTPRVDVFAWDGARTLAGIALELGTVPYSRVPVFDETIDNITGVLYIRDAYQALVAGQRDVRLTQLAREPLIVPGSLSLTTLLRDFQTRRIHLAVVVDEYGGTDGLVTLEDVLEELVGEIVDETDVAYDPIVRVSRHEVMAAGDADLREINHFFNIALPQLEHRSLNGYLLEELGRVPEEGEVVDRQGIRMEVAEATGSQVLRVRLRRLPPQPGTPGERQTAARGEVEAAPEKAPRSEAGPMPGPPPRADGPGEGPDEGQGHGDAGAQGAPPGG